MLKRIVAMVLALSFVGIVAMAPNAHARRGGCTVDDAGIDCVHGG